MRKNIVICCDGTGQNGLRYTNVSRLFGVLDLREGANQVACYDPGVGTVPDREVKDDVQRRDPGALCRSALDSLDATGATVPYLLSQARRLSGLAVGTGLFENVREMYEVLVEHYDAEGGTDVFLFGFSRGAFTVRVLAGLLCRCGLLRREYRHLYPEAFRLYEPHLESFSEEERAAFEAELAAFKGEYARPCPVKFLGVWDTVKSVGYLRPVSVPHTRRNTGVEVVRHALSIGESRSFFAPTTWGGLDGETEPRGCEAPGAEAQDVQEVWFAGVHSDVGGGHAEAESGLALVSLRWMLGEACGLRLDRDRLDAMWRRSAGASSTPHDELKGPSVEARFWRLSEHFPRMELKNDPPPPKRLFRRRPAGRRRIGASARGGEVLIDEHAREFYATAAVPRPWTDSVSEPDAAAWSRSRYGFKEFRVAFLDTATGEVTDQEIAWVELGPDDLKVVKGVPLLDELLGRHLKQLDAGGAAEAYRNHCYRVLNFCLALSLNRRPAIDKIAFAAAFHDMGIWTEEEDNFDYLEPSRALARRHLEKEGRGDWMDEVDAMVDNHHKFTRYRHRPDWLVEAFRKADWADVTKGALSYGLPRAFVLEVRTAFPDAGFHGLLREQAWKRFRSHPLSPFPMARL